MKQAINCGSGQRPFASSEYVHWDNVDKIARPGYAVDVLCDGAHLPHLDASIDYFVLHHVLEHFGCGEAAGLIAESYRVLRPGGSLLVFVPNLQALAARWLGGELDTQVYLTNVYGAYMAGEEESRHRWGFDAVSLSEFLWKGALWTHMRPFDWRVIPGMEPARDWWIMAAECIK